ncbi:class I SAM-dependent methyltransferase [Pedobacter sp. SAFR-022]|uniref:class I SAM-dependent methyltransferase n=1 Tax=Pedobacter sp. SAFR-022 TaxID=3436861 RepID=UPI003F7ED13F
MNASNQPEVYLEKVKEALASGSFLKVTLSNYTGAEPELKNIYLRLVEIKRQAKLSFTFRYKTRDIVKNFDLPEGEVMLGKYVQEEFSAATLFTTTVDWSLQRKGDRWSIKQLGPSMTKPEGSLLSHDKTKARKITSTGKQYLVDLGLTDASGTVFKNAQDKYKQINQYIEILSPLIASLPAGSIKKVADMGSGKGYLTFALYDYLVNTLKQDVQVTGVEFREDMVGLCNQIGSNAGFTGLDFAQGTIDAYDTAGVDMLIALHACDTATDDAIYKGIQAGAQLIVTAPCCHKQIRKEIVKGKQSNALDFITQHGIFLERQAEMVTDGLRALIMEYFGYQTKIMQFISDQHTPKNVLIIGTRKTIAEARKVEILEQIRSTKAFFGIGYHHLEKLSGLSG